LEGKKRILRRGENRSVFINRENSFPYFIYVVARLKHVSQSTLSEHNIETGHQILFDKTITITNITSYFPKKYREAIKIQKHPNNLNRDNGYNINKKCGKLFSRLLMTDHNFSYFFPLLLLTILFFLLTTLTSSVI